MEYAYKHQVIGAFLLYFSPTLLLIVDWDVTS